MNAKELAFNELLPIVEALPARDRKKPKLPIDVLIQETADILVFAEEDLPVLNVFGIDQDYLADLEKRMHALIFAEARWSTRQLRGNEKATEAKTLYEELVESRKELVAVYRFAIPDRTSWLQDVAKGKSYDAVIQSCYELAVFGKEHVEQLEPLGWTNQRLDQLLADVEELSAAKANRPVIDYEILEYCRVRDLFFSYLWMSLSNLRRTGQLALRNKPTRARQYSSSYNRRKIRNT